MERMSKPQDSIEVEDSEAGRYFQSMAQFVGLSQEDIETIRETRFIIEKHIPEIVAKFYDHLLRYPPTRKYFLNKDGTLDEEYLRLRMHHLTNFWRRTAAAEFDNAYARYVDYVGQAHTSQGADPKVYIPERYVIGQVGFVQHAISDALQEELHEIDPDLENRALKAWNLLLMVILEILSRAYSSEREIDPQQPDIAVDSGGIQRLAQQTYERNLDLYRSIEFREVRVGSVEEIPEGERKLIEIDGLSFGVFHHKGQWYAVRNHCLHRGGPIATGTLEGDTLTCPWHGYQYDLTDGRLLLDSSSALETWPVEVREGGVYLQIAHKTWDLEPAGADGAEASTTAQGGLAENEFLIQELPPGAKVDLLVDGRKVIVYNVDGELYATQEECTHANGRLCDGDLEGKIITCPLHDSRFDVTNGKVVQGPAKRPLKTYRIIREGDIGHVA